MGRNTVDSQPHEGSYFGMLKVQHACTVLYGMDKGVERGIWSAAIDLKELQEKW